MITMPSDAWASAFREHARRSGAEFVLRDGRSHYVPSITREAGDYISTLEARAFTVRAFKAFYAHDVVGPVSSKLLVGGYKGAVLDGYWFQKKQK